MHFFGQEGVVDHVSRREGTRRLPSLLGLFQTPRDSTYLHPLTAES